MKNATKWYILDEKRGPGTGHLNPKNTPWSLGLDGAWTRRTVKVERRSYSDALPWIILIDGQPKTCRQGFRNGLRMYKTAAAAMLALTGNRTVFATSPWRSDT